MGVLVLPAIEVGAEGGESLVALHGARLTRQQWVRVGAEALPARRWICLDLRGHGDAPTGERPWTIAQMALDVVATLDARGIATTDVIGHSLGGRIAVEVARVAPSRVRSLVLLDPPLLAQDEWIELRGRYARDPARSRNEFESLDEVVAARTRGLPKDVMPYAVHETTSCLKMTETGRFRLRANPELLNEIGNDTDYANTSLGTYPGYVLLVVAGRFHAVTELGHARFRSQLGDRLTSVTIDDSGHYLLWDAYERTVSAISEFFDGV